MHVSGAPLLPCMRCVRMDGHGIAGLPDMILQFFPLDGYVPHPVTLREVLPGDPYVPEIWAEYRENGGKQKEDLRELAAQCVQAGYTSLMIDGSLLPYDENVALTCRVVEMAGELPVEAELGMVGGKEDGHEAAAQYTDPVQAVDFVKRTGISSFAVAIGTAHGLYAGEPKLDLDLLREIALRASIPLVLHGASGVPAGQVRSCIRRGICKVNFATELRIAFTNGVRQALLGEPEAFAPKMYLKAGRETVRQKVTELIRLCGSEGKG